MQKQAILNNTNNYQDINPVATHISIMTDYDPANRYTTDTIGLTLTNNSSTVDIIMGRTEIWEMDNVSISKVALNNKYSTGLNGKVYIDWEE